MSDPATLADAIRATGPLIERFLEGFDDENRVKQMPSLPNHAAWTLGHLALVMNRAADYVSGFTEPQRLPTSDWIHGDGTAGDPSRYDTEAVAFGSTPVADPAKYPRMVRAREIFMTAVKRFADETAAASPKALEREVKWGSATIVVDALVHRVIFHNGTHAGQLIDLRRALKLPQVIG
tara:strand:- start:112 stop:648 length:537 start_codon:yes stop_codon:yes gene_type:complete